MFGFRLHKGRPAKPSLSGIASSIRKICLAAILIAGFALPALATDIVTTTITGTVDSGSDGTGYFGVGSSLAGQDFTLTIRYPDQTGSDINCSGGGPVYFSEMTTTGQGEGDLEINGVVFQLASAPISATNGEVDRYTKITGCSSFSRIYNLFQVTYDTTGTAFSGDSSVADAYVYPASGVLTTDPEWDDPFTVVSTAATPVQDIQLHLSYGGNPLVNVIAYLTPETIEVDSSAAPDPVPPAAGNNPPVNQGGGTGEGTNGCPLCGNPVNTGTGNKFQPENDYVGAPSTHLSLTRYYNSYGSAQGPFGTGWTSNYTASLSGPTSGVVTVTRGDGRIDSFTQSGSNWVSDPDVTSDLIPVMSGMTQIGWEVLRPDDSIENYNMSGVLTSLTTRAGLVTTLSYTSGNLTTVTGPYSQTLTFTYDGSNRVRTMTDPNGKVYTYFYSVDGYNNLVAVAYPDNSARAYSYTNLTYPNLLTGIMDELGNQYASYSYDSTGRATVTQHAGGVDQWTFTYNMSGTVTATDALSNNHTYTMTTPYSIVKPSAVSGDPYPPAGGSAFTYDGNGFVASKTDWNGNVTTYTHDSRGNETQRIEAYGTALARTITTTWHATFNLPLTITEPARTTTFTYDADGNMLTKSVTDGTHTSVLTYTYDTNGNVLTAEDPDTNTTTYTYNADGTMATMVNAASQTTTYNTYDSNKRLTKMTDPNGLTTEFTYDYRGRMLTKKLNALLTTTYTYDAAGNLTKVKQPDASYLAYTYDAAHRLTKITDEAGNYTTYTLDAMGNRTAVSKYTSGNVLKYTHTYTYDASNRMETDSGAYTGETSNYTYDDQGNQLTAEDPNSNTYTKTYDYLNRLSTVEDPASNTATYGYDSEDNLTSIQDPAGNTTTYGYDGLGRQTSLASPDTGSSSMTYDAMGNVLTVTDARSDVSTYTYDALNRKATSAYTGGGSATYTYDSGTYGKGHLTEVADGTGNTQWTYNIYGQPTQRQQTTGSIVLTVAYAYDSDGRLHTITYPSGKVLTYTYSANGQISAASFNSSGVAGSVTWMPFGGINTWSTSHAVTFTRSFDQDYRITSLALGSVNTQGLTWDVASRLTGLTETGLSNKTYGYDDLDRLTSVTIGTASPTSWTYDDNGNRTKTTDPSSNVTNYNYTANTNNLASLSGHVAQTFTTDASGNMTGDGTNTWTYDQRGRMATNVASSVTTTYSINDLGLRVKKTNTGTTNYYAYDEHGHVLGEYDSTGAAIKETAYIDDLPVGVLSKSGATYTIYSLLPDWLGAPHIITNSSGTQAWTWDHLAWGDNAPNQNPGGFGTFIYDWRLPGQIYDSESTLNYNRTRDYSPTLSRYVESDSIGLTGGDYSTYSYVKGNPLSVTDASGLIGCPKYCVGPARVIKGNPDTIGLTGGWQKPVYAGSAAVIASQWGGSGTLRPYIADISGMTQGFQLFYGISDTIGGDSEPIPGHPPQKWHPSQKLMSRYPGTLIIELVTGEDMGTVPIVLTIPTGLSCPAFTTAYDQISY